MPWPSTDSGMKSEDDGVDGDECDSDYYYWLE